MELDDGIILLEEIITKNRRHVNYKRVNDLAKLYRTFYTGDGIADELEKMYKIKIPEMLINSIVPPILKSTMFPFQKVARTKPVIRKIDYAEKEYENKKSELEGYISRYYHGNSLEKFFRQQVIEHLYVDPNAWVVTEFKSFDPLKEKAKPYPLIVTCAEAIDFMYEGETLRYLVIKQDYEKKSKYTMYLGEFTIVYIEDEGGEVTLSNGKRYRVEMYNPKGSFIPAVRVGYITDIETKAETFLSVFDKIVPFIYKQLKVDFEGDSSMAELAFPRRSVYVENCPSCYNGIKPDGMRCDACAGSGRAKTHRTASDVREFPLPPDVNEVMDLSKLSYTEHPPVEGLRFQQEYKDSLKAQMFSFMFNAELFSKDEVTATATEKQIHRDNLNDALFPFSQHLSSLWVFIVRTIAEFTDLSENIILEHIYPEDFKFRNLQDLTQDLKGAKDAGASATTIAMIEEDMWEMVYADRPEELKKLRIKNSFNPFAGRSDDQVRLIISTRKAPPFNIIMWCNLDSIFKELEREHQSPYLYDLNYGRIWELVEGKVEEYMTKIPSMDEPVNMNDMQFNEDGD